MESSVIKKFALETYGCQMNVADSELVEGILTNLGLEKTANYDEADAIFLNTCAIRENAETKVHSKLGNLHKICLLYTSPSPRDRTRSRMPSSA